mgnify:CR=1 FL=1
MEQEIVRILFSMIQHFKRSDIMLNVRRNLRILPTNVLILGDDFERSKSNNTDCEKEMRFERPGLVTMPFYATCGCTDLTHYA